MPQIVDKIPLPLEYDRRRKLSDDQKDEIRHKYATGLYSLRTLAEEYNVSKKLILLIVNPASKEKNDARLKEHWSDYKVSKEERARIMKEYRRYKMDLYKKGKINV